MNPMIQKSQSQTWFERTILILPLFIMILTAVEMATGLEFSGREILWLKLIVALVFFNLIHQVFSYLLIWRLPFASDILNQKFGQSKYFWLGFFVFQILVFVFLIFAFEAFTIEPELQKSLIFLFLIINGLAVTQHGLKQVQGISLLYGRESGQNDWQRKKEHLFMNFVLIGLCLNIALQVLPTQYPDLKILSDSLLYPIIALTYLPIFLLFKMVYNYQTGSSKKMLYLTRLLLWPLVPVSQMALLGVGIIHGSEFTYVTWRITQSLGRKQNFSLRSWYFTFLIFGVLFSLLSLTRINGGLTGLFITEDSSQVPFWLVIGSAMTGTITFGHIYLDHILFGFKNSAVRKHLSPLLKL